MNNLTQFLLTCFYVIIPAALANMMPVFVQKINFLNTPIDFNKRWFDDKPIFGNHKTYRGFFFGISAAIGITFIQKLLYNYPFFQQISFFNYNEISFLLVGFMIGFGVLFGDLVKSFFKRRVNVKPGDSFFPWDQLDLVIGAIIFIYILQPIPWTMILFYLIVGPALHVFFNHVGFWLGIRETKW